MPKTITSTDWHLEGVSVEARRLVAAYHQVTGTKQGEIVDEAIRRVLPAMIREHLAVENADFNSNGTPPNASTGWD